MKGKQDWSNKAGAFFYKKLKGDFLLQKASLDNVSFT